MEAPPILSDTLKSGADAVKEVVKPMEEKKIELEQKMEAIYHNVKATATEFNKRGDFHAGANIAAFLRVADAMLAHGSV